MTFKMSGQKDVQQQIVEMNKAVISFSDRWDESKKVPEEFQKSITNLHSCTAAVKKKQEDLKENLRELVSAAESEANYFKELNSQSSEPQMKALKSNMTKAEKQKEDLEKELVDVTSTITHKKEVLKDLQNQTNSSHQETSASMSRIRAEYSLYSKLFNIKWDHSMSDSHIKGFVLKPTEKRVVPFKFDKTSHSQFFIANYLWEQIGVGSSLNDS